ncbi:MAG: sugar phosphate isomerase/epimerase family protein [Mangrovibacterium sp.]
MEVMNLGPGRFDRRRFIKGMTVAGLAMPVMKAFGAELFSGAGKDAHIAFFTKPLDRYETAFMAETLVMAGFDGFDLTVRPGGKVEPERVADDLPKVMEIGRKHGLATDMIVTSVTEANSLSEKVLTAASKNGVKHYRMGYISYNFKEGIEESLRKIKAKLPSLVALNKQAGIQAGYQNHTGIRMGAPVWDLWQLIHDFTVEQISAQFDIRHAVTEGAVSWPLGMRLIGEHIGSLAIKDFTWEVVTRKARVMNVPLGEGIVDFNQYFSILRELNISAPITLHVEYPLLDKDEESLSLLQQQKIIVTKLKKDVDFIRKHLSQV